MLEKAMATQEMRRRTGPARSARSNRLLWLVPQACVGALALPGAAQAAVAWTSTFEKGDLSEWTPGINATKTLAGGMVRENVVVQEAQVYTGKYACEITVHPDDLFGQYVQDRVDIQHQSTLTGEGQDTWISGHYLMLADAGCRNEFAFWESNVSSTNVMDFWVEPKSEGGTGTTINFGVGFLGATQLWSADFAIGKWHQVAIHVHWSTNAKLGSVDVWFDGQQVVTAYKAQTKADGNTLFYQNGLHRKVEEPFVDAIYFDDFIEADSFAEAKIGAPTASAPDGGALGPSGTDGGAVDAALEASMSVRDSSTGGGPSGSTDDAASGSATTGSGVASGAPASSGSGAAGSAVGSSGAMSDTLAPSGSAAPAASSPSKGCAIASTAFEGSRAPVFGWSLAMLAFTLVRRRAKPR
jgi:Polysaccharide lyase